MNNPFSQPKIIYKIYFTTNYECVERFEAFFPEDEILGLGAHEIDSSTIDSQAKDTWIIEIFVSQKPDIKSLIDSLALYAKENQLKIISQPAYEIIEDKDWVKEYQKQLEPIEIGDFFITSSLREKECPKDKIPIYIEASRAFGTGDHATTAMCIKAMEYIKSNEINNIFDIGTGSGILSFAAEKIWPAAKILACDIEETSVQVAKINQNFNSSNIDFYQNSESNLNIPETWPKKFDLIVANILAVPLIAMKDSISSLCHKDSRVILSGFLDYQKQDLERNYFESGLDVEKSFLEDKWVSLILTPVNDNRT